MSDRPAPGVVWVIVAAVVASPSIIAAQSNDKRETEQQESNGRAADPEAGPSDEESLEQLLDSLDDQPDEKRERKPRKGDEQRIERREVPLEELSVAEARERGFEFGDRRDRRGGGIAPLAALTAGAPLHGVGHLVAGKPTTGWWLMGSEAVGAGLLVTGVVGANNADGGWSYGVARTVGVLGAGLLGAGYLADVVGTVPAEGTGLPRNQRLHRGLSVEAGYQFRRADTSSLSHFGRAAVGYDGGWWSARAETEQELQFSASSATLSGALTPSFGGPELTHPTLELSGSYLVARHAGSFRRITVSALGGGSLDLRAISADLGQFAVGALGGLHRSWLLWNGTNTANWLPAAQVFTHFNLNKRLHIRLDYRLEPDAWLAPDRHLAGIGGLDLTFSTEGPLDLHLGGRLGAGIGIVTGVKYRR